MRKPFQDRGFAGGIEKAFMSTSLDPETALQYSSSKESRSGAIFQIEFDIASRGADVQWLSQYPAERELLYPPCTSLTCTDMVEIGEKKILQVTATVSTRRPDVSWCEHCDSTPPEHELGHRPPVHNEIGPFRSTPLADAGEVECELAPGISGGTYKLDLVVGAGEQRRPATFTGELATPRGHPQQGGEAPRQHPARRGLLRVRLSHHGGAVVGAPGPRAGGPRRQRARIDRRPAEYTRGEARPGEDGRGQARRRLATDEATRSDPSGERHESGGAAAAVAACIATLGR